MKKHLINSAAALVIIAGLAWSVVAPWWAVILLCIPAVWAGVVAILLLNTKYVTEL